MLKALEMIYGDLKKVNNFWNVEVNKLCLNTV